MVIEGELRLQSEELHMTAQVDGSNGRIYLVWQCMIQRIGRMFVAGSARSKRVGLLIGRRAWANPSLLANGACAAMSGAVEPAKARELRTLKVPIKLMVSN